MDSGKENSGSLYALIACGENSIKDLFTAGLEDTFSVIGVDSAREAIGYLMTRSIHILVTYLELSDVDGWRLIRMVRSGRFCAGTLPIVMVYDELSIPSSLANEHNISTISLDEVYGLSKVAKASLQGSSNPRILKWFNRFVQSS